MKNSRTALILGFALFALTSIAQAQLIYRDAYVTGVTNGVTARFQIWINAQTNTFVVDIDNSLPAGPNTKVGTITGFAFNTPWTNPNIGTITMASKWTKWNTHNGHNVPKNVWAGDDFWDETANFNLGGSAYTQDYGVSTPSPGGPNLGVEYGEKATFVFTFSQDITQANFAGFFDKSYDLSVRWQEVDKLSYYDDCFDGPGSDKGKFGFNLPSGGDLPPTPEPSTYGLMGAAALLGLVAHRRQKAKKALKTA